MGGRCESREVVGESEEDASRDVNDGDDEESGGNKRGGEEWKEADAGGSMGGEGREIGLVGGIAEENEKSQKQEEGGQEAHWATEGESKDGEGGRKHRRYRWRNKWRRE